MHGLCNGEGKMALKLIMPEKEETEESLIQAKMKELLREQAITALQSEGKLTAEGKMVKL